MSTNEKLDLLVKRIKTYKRIAIAFSGGIDSALLVFAAKLALGNKNVIAVTIKTPYLPERDLIDATEFCAQLDVNHIIIDTPVPDHIRPNSIDRCYHCKKYEFSLIIKKAEEYFIDKIAAGLNTDDPADYRPGISAMDELKVIFPLRDAFLSKKEIRFLAKNNNISLWDKPANACILSRVPYGDYITDDAIRMIQKAERILQDEGFTNSRVRTYGKVACIEVEKGEITKLIENNLTIRIYNSFIKLGYTRITIDILGYQTGSMNKGVVNQI